MGVGIGFFWAEIGEIGLKVFGQGLEFFGYSIIVSGFFETISCFFETILSGRVRWIDNLLIIWFGNFKTESLRSQEALRRREKFYYRFHGFA